MGSDFKKKWERHSQQRDEVRHLILLTDDSVVFVDNDGNVDWETSDVYDQAGHKDDAAFYGAINQAALLEAMPCEGLATGAVSDFKRMIGEAIARALLHEYALAAEMLEHAKGFLTARSEETSRRWFLNASFLSVLPFLMIGAVLWSSRAGIIACSGPEVLWVGVCASAGALGSLFSVITRAGSLTLDCSSGRRLHELEGFARISAGAIGGILACLAVRSGMLLSAFARADHQHIVLILAALVAGASERLAPSIISSVDQAARGARTGKGTKSK